jgi:hypothetical protein
MRIVAAVALAGMSATLLAACTKDVQALDGSQIEQRYGVPGAYSGAITTADGSMTGTLVPITLADGRQAHLFIPPKQAGEPHAVYLRDNDGLHPVQLQDRTTRDQVARSPAIVERRAEPQHVNKRSWEKEALIIGGSAGAGTGIGALAGGKKGAGVGAAAGGVGGLIYDLMTRDKK